MRTNDGRAGRACTAPPRKQRHPRLLLYSTLSERCSLARRRRTPHASAEARQHDAAARQPEPQTRRTLCVFTHCARPGWAGGSQHYSTAALAGSVGGRLSRAQPKCEFARRAAVHMINGWRRFRSWVGDQKIWSRAAGLAGAPRSLVARRPAKPAHVPLPPPAWLEPLPLADPLRAPLCTSVSE